jgi:hypothetical protein
MRNSVSISIDPSTSDQDCHSKELLSATEPTTYGSRDGERTLLLNNGISMKSPRLSRITTGSHIPLISNLMVAQTTLDAQPLTQDGGKCSDTKVPQLSTRKERFWKFKEELTKKTETLVSILNPTKSTNNGTLFM